jgi:transposase
MQFGRSSEKIDRIIEQLELMLDELETEAAVGPVAADPSTRDVDDESAGVRRKSPGRRPLPEHLPRREIVHTPDCTCPACGGAMRKVGEDISEVLDYIPGRFEVIRHIRPALSCRRCESMVQMPMPSLPVERGRPSAPLPAHILSASIARFHAYELVLMPPFRTLPLGQGTGLVGVGSCDSISDL